MSIRHEFVIILISDEPLVMFQRNVFLTLEEEMKVSLFLQMTSNFNI